MEIEGHCEPRFEAVRDAFARNFEQAGEVGASFAMTMDGETVVDLWGGHADAARTRAWQQDTIVNVYSTTKTMTALCALLLADRGELDFDAPVARYWPEFAAGGKAAVTVGHLMSHSAGLSGFDVPVRGEALYDWEHLTTLLAAQKPWWEPGTQSGYHALTQGHLVGEVVRRISGVSLGNFFRAEIAEPLGADFHIGLADEHFPRVAELIPPEGGDAPAGDEDSVAVRTFASPAVDARDAGTAAWRRAEIPAANGHGNARSVARIQSVLACGGEVAGRRLMSEAGCRRAMEEQTNGMDLVLGVPVRFGLGYGLTSEVFPLGPNPNTCFWGGWGGSLVIVDQDTRVCMAYAMNRMMATLTGDPRGGGLAMAAFGSLGAAG